MAEDEIKSLLMLSIALNLSCIYFLLIIIKNINMEIKDQVLSIEQMQHLKELGVDTSKASMCWWRRVRDFRGEKVEGQWNLSFNKSYIVQNFEQNEDIPTFTFDDIFELLPKEITRKDNNEKAYLEIIFPNNGVWEVTYAHITVLESFFNEKLIDAAYEMLCWCVEKGYINNK